MKRIFITLVAIITASIPTFLFSRYESKNVKQPVIENTTVEKVSEKKIKKSEEVKIEEPTEEDKNNSSSENSISKAEISTKETRNENNNSNNIPKKDTQNEHPIKQEQPVESTQVQETQPSVSQPWDVYGKTEYQYYNEPMYNWEKVDFSVRDYGSEQAAYNACVTYGDAYEPYKKGQVLYNCRTVVSASGKYLGIMFSTEKLN